MIDEEGRVEAILMGEMPDDLSDEARGFLTEMAEDYIRANNARYDMARRVKEMRERHDRIMSSDELKVKQEFISLLNYISSGGVSGSMGGFGRPGLVTTGQYVGLRFDRAHIEMLQKIVGLKPGAPDEKYISYDMLKEKYETNKAALEAALEDLRNDENAAALFNIRRVLGGLDANDDIVEAVARLVDKSVSNDETQVLTTLVDKEGNPSTPSLEVSPGSKKVH